ncbi:hypothetical protein QIX46_17900 [Lysinibacillus boronitolerans]|nr:hypothetical protein QIX46_17900 [Lysinibacillus boronitolerans]
MENGQKITIALRASHLAHLAKIRGQLLSRLKEKDKGSYHYLEKLPLDNLAMICFTLGFSNKSLIAELERAISLHVLFNDIQSRQTNL